MPVSSSTTKFSSFFSQYSCATHTIDEVMLDSSLKTTSTGMAMRWTSSGCISDCSPEVLWILSGGISNGSPAASAMVFSSVTRSRTCSAVMYRPLLSSISSPLPFSMAL